MKYLLPILALALSASGRVAKREDSPSHNLLERDDNSTVQVDWGKPPPSCPPQQTATVTTTQKEKYALLPEPRGCSETNNFIRVTETYTVTTTVKEKYVTDIILKSG